jgi:acyl carrier protein|tara:strand:+ start:110 stop:337 length:228 start_codon:yes stop_codon:yes gene_type:complete
MIEKKIYNCLKIIFKNNKIPKNIKNLKIGSFKSWDSLSHLNLLLTIEKEFKIKFPLKKIYEIRTIKEVITYINKK